MSEQKSQPTDKSQVSVQALKGKVKATLVVTPKPKPKEK